MATAKKTSVRNSKKSSSKKTTSRVGTSKLVAKRGFKLWMAALVVVLVAVAGYAIVNFSEASGYTYYSKDSTNCPKVSKNNGTNPYHCKTGQKVDVGTKITSSGSYRICFNVVGAYGARWQYITESYSRGSGTKKRYVSTVRSSQVGQNSRYNKQKTCTPYYSHKSQVTVFSALKVLSNGSDANGLGGVFVYHAWREKG